MTKKISPSTHQLLIQLFVVSFVGLIIAIISSAGANDKPNPEKNIIKAKTTVITPSNPKETGDKPKVELFIMSYCPYGLQMQKAYLPVMELLGEKADIDIKFVSYIMHQKIEADENTTQYCIMKDQNDKYIDYAKCFVGTGKSDTCLASAKIDKTKLASCVSETDKTYKITESFNNKATWLNGRYPLYSIHKDLNTKYGVQGSPTLIINGVKADKVSRTPEAVKNAICDSFKGDKPTECQTVLSSQGFQPGFGATAGATQEATCN